MWCSSGSPRRKLVLWRSGNVVSFLLNPSLPPPSQTYIAPVSLISVILSVIQALLQCHHKCVFNVINDFVVVGQMAVTLPRWRNVKSGARNDERGAGRQIWGQVLLNLQGDVVQISRQLFLFFFPFTAHVDQDSWTVFILSHSPVIGHGQNVGKKNTIRSALLQISNKPTAPH